MTYIPHDWWMICQKTGIKFRVSEMREEPNKDDPNSGRWVHQSSYDPVHPQEYVQGTEDDPSVPLTYPDVANAMGETVLIHNMGIYSTRIIVESTVTQGDPLGVIQNNGILYWSFAQTVELLTNGPLVDADGEIVIDADGEIIYTADVFNGYIVALGSQIHNAADLGNAVYLPALDNEEWQ
jgi:hypothetical protein